MEGQGPGSEVSEGQKGQSPVPLRPRSPHGGRQAPTQAAAGEGKSPSVSPKGLCGPSTLHPRQHAGLSSLEKTVPDLARLRCRDTRAPSCVTSRQSYGQSRILTPNPQRWGPAAPLQRQRDRGLDKQRDHEFGLLSLRLAFMFAQVAGKQGGTESERSLAAWSLESRGLGATASLCLLLPGCTGGPLWPVSEFSESINASSVKRNNIYTS